jgi:hypothetical protein
VTVLAKTAHVVEHVKPKTQNNISLKHHGKTWCFVIEVVYDTLGAYARSTDRCTKSI